MGHKLAIDFGTTNSVIARWKDDTSAIEVIHVPGLSAIQEDSRRGVIPSLLYVQDGWSGRVTIGQAVLDDQLERKRDNRLFLNFKRGIAAGSSLEPRIIDGAPWTDHDAGRLFLQELVAALPYPLDDIERLVVTVPVSAFEGYAAWLSEAMGGIPENRIHILDESTAAALGYAVTQPGAVVLVIDFGGGSLDLSLVQLPESREKTGGLLGRILGRDSRGNAARVIAKAGATIGGMDIDQWLLAEVLERTGQSPQDLGVDYAALLRTCEDAKIALSTAESTLVGFATGGSQPLSLPFTRTELEALLDRHAFYTALDQAVDRVMRTAHRRGIFKEDVNHVLLVGGTSLIPSVQQLLKGYFRDTAVRVDKPFTAIAEGALQVAAGLGLDDYLVHSYGLRHLDPHSGEHRYEEILPMGSRYPTEKPVSILLGAAYPDQPAIEFVIGQIDAEAVSMVEVKYEDGQAVFVAQADHSALHIRPLNTSQGETTLVDLDPPGKPGDDRLRADFTIDGERHLRLTVTDLLSGERLLQDAPLARLGSGSSEALQPEIPLTSREPRLSSSSQPGSRRLSLRGLATTLNLLPPEAISLAAAIEALHSPDWAVRAHAASLLARRGDRDARLTLQDALTRAEAPVRANVARQLHYFSWFAAEPLFRQALDDADWRVRESAIYALCQFHDPRAYQLMVEVLPDESDNVRLAAAWGLSLSPDPRAVPVLEIALRAQDPEVRIKTLESLGATQAAEAVPVVRAALQDSDLDVRYAATLSMLELAGEACLPELTGIIEDTRGPERLCILRGLFHATNYLRIDIALTPAVEDMIDTLSAASLDEDPEVRVLAAMTLAWMRHDLAATTLREIYHRERDSQVKARLLRAAIDLMSPAGQDLLSDALRGQDALVRATAEYLVTHRRNASG